MELTALTVKKNYSQKSSFNCQPATKAVIGRRTVSKLRSQTGLGRSLSSSVLTNYVFKKSIAEHTGYSKSQEIKLAYYFTKLLRALSALAMVVPQPLFPCLMVRHLRTWYTRELNNVFDSRHKIFQGGNICFNLILFSS